MLESFCENLERETVMPYLDQLMNKLVDLLRSPKPKIQSMAIGAIAATAVAAEEDFLKYFEHVIGKIYSIMQR